MTTAATAEEPATSSELTLLIRSVLLRNTVYWYFRSWQRNGVWVRLQREIYRLTRIRSGRSECPTVVIMDGQSVKTTEVGGTRGFDAFKRGTVESDTFWSIRSACQSPIASRPPIFRTGAPQPY